MSKVATLTIGDKQIEFPIIVGSEGEQAIDISRLRAETGLVTYDHGFVNTASCRSKITFIDGEKGILRYRGIPIENFAVENPDFLDTAWHLIFGKLPSKDELSSFKKIIIDNVHINEAMKHNYEGLPSNALPMATLSAMINAISCFHPEFLTIEDDASFAEASGRIISKIRTLVAFSYRKTKGLPIIYADPKLDYCSNFMHMMFSMPYQPYAVTEEVRKALNLIFILHADHEQNCSTSTVRMVGSSGANLFASLASGVCALWGPKHGGANQAVIEMLDRIHKGNVSPADCIEQAKDKNNSFRLMGFGHRVYKNYDPRAKVLKKSCDKILGKMNIQDPLLDIAKELEELALKDEYFVKRKLFPNVDFYSGIILRAIGIPTDMFPVMFSIGRLPGWIAQWKEQQEDPENRIFRPRQIYEGPNESDFIPIEER